MHAPRVTRRAVIAAAAASFPARGGAATPALTVDAGTTGGVRVERADHGIVGVFDVDWLTRPGFARMLDGFAASPGAVHGVRCFGALSAGTREAMLPSSGGTVWPSPDAPIDFAPAFAALEALTSRGLVPFVSLGFFPPAVSPSPIAPPPSWHAWGELVRRFFDELAADPRFGPEAIAGWWFEVWNEPNEGRFWSDTPEQYLALYRATSAAVDAAGVRVRLGGPAIAYKPQVEPASGAPWIERFLRFVAADPALRCDFVSFHRKGSVGDDPPDPRRLEDAAVEVAELALAIDPVRFAGLTIVDDEADEKVGFEVPYAPRMDERNAAWLAASACIHAGLTARYRDTGFRFMAAADNANLQLVQAPFDGRRCVVTRASAGTETDLIALAPYGFYELLRLLGERQVPVIAGAARLFPGTGLRHLATAGEHGIACLLCHYPDPNGPDSGSLTVPYAVTGIPWPRVNVARFRIDRAHANAYAAAGGGPANPFPAPDPAALPRIRLAAALTPDRPVAHGIVVTSGVYRAELTLAPYDTLLLWVTPVRPDAPVTPTGLTAAREASIVRLSWTPNREPWLLGYELAAADGAGALRPMGPPLGRAATWVDDAPPPGRRYAVRAVSASGVASGWATGAVPPG